MILKEDGYIRRDAKTRVEHIYDFLGFYYQYIKFPLITHRKTPQSHSLHDDIIRKWKNRLSIDGIKGAFSSLRQFLATRSPIKMMKNAFYFNLKVFLVVKIFNFLSWLFDHVKKRLDEKDNVNFKIHDVTTWLTNNCNAQLTNISRSKDKQTMKFGQLIEYNMRNIFLEKFYRKCGGDTIPRAFSKKSKLRYWAICVL